jgi:predicted phage terminase large subunit-like protein
MRSIEFRKLTRKKFLQELALLGQEQRAMIEAQVDGFEVNAEASARRRTRGRTDYRFFCETYFPHFIDSSKEPSIFQLHAYTVPPMMQDTPGARCAEAAPRGEGKSTILIQLHAIWRICYGLSHYMPLIMDAKEQAEMMLDAVKAELEVNPRLLQDFPEACGRGRIWNVAKMVSASGIMIEVFGAGKKIRGRRFGAYRPDFVFIDDFENDENVKSKEWRDKREAWLRKVVANLGPPDGSMRQIYVGTVLYPDAVFLRTVKNPRWKATSHLWPSIHTWPDRMELWDQWEEIFLNDSELAADGFYRLHQAEMEAGAKVSWPSVRPLLVLMKLRAEDRKAFDTEHQHNPVDPEGHPFVGSIRYYVLVKRNWLHFGAHDPSMGKGSSRGDPSATVVGAMDRDEGKLNVVEGIVSRRVPDRQIEDITRLQGEYRCLLWGVEIVAFQEFFKDELVKRSAKAGYPIPARGIKSAENKDLRIESLQPHMANGLILFNRNHSTLISLFEQWPDGHDDGPDAVEMLWQVATKGMRGLRLPGKRGGGGRKQESGELLQGYGS